MSYTGGAFTAHRMRQTAHYSLTIHLTWDYHRSDLVTVNHMLPTYHKSDLVPVNHVLPTVLPLSTAVHIFLKLTPTKCLEWFSNYDHRTSSRNVIRPNMFGSFAMSC